MRKRDNDVFYDKGHGFYGSDNRIWMQRCFKCGKENHALAVSTGKCAWCGFDANDSESKPKGKK